MAAVATVRALVGHQDVDRGLLPAWAREHADATLKFPLARPVPVYVGAMGPRMLTMAGAHADGALPLLYPPERFAVARANVLAGATPGGREVDLPACFWVSLSADPGRARNALAEKLAYYGPSFSAPMLAEAGLRPADFDRAARLAHTGRQAAALIDDRMLSLGIAGDAAEVIARCRALQAMGARHLSFGPPLGPDPLAAIGLLGSQVLPALSDLPERSEADPGPANEGPGTW